MRFDCEVRRAREADWSAWRRLVVRYAEFYETEFTDEPARTVWGWLLADAHDVEGLVAVAPDGTVVGFAHFRAFHRPSDASVAGYLEDLYVEPDFRGSGAADALLGALQAIGRERGWSVIRWITADNNYRARGKYDRHASRTGWITYDMPPVPVSS